MVQWRLEVVVGSVEGAITSESPFVTIKFLSFPALSIAASRELNPPSSPPDSGALRRVKYNAGKAMVFDLTKAAIAEELGRAPLYLMVPPSSSSSLSPATAAAPLGGTQR